MSVVPLNPWLAHRPRRGNTVVDTAVIHSCEGESVESLVQQLRAQDHSYHYIIDENGTIYKGVPFSATAFHCGNSYGPHEAQRGISAERDAAGSYVEHPCVNEYSLGLCFVLPNDEGSYTAEQLKACTTLLTDLKTPLPKLKYLTGHAQVSPGKFHDPVNLDLNELAKACGLEFWSLELSPA